MTVYAVKKPVKQPKKKRKKIGLTKAETRKAIRKLEKELKAICSAICKILWGGKCAVCGKEGTAAHHFFGWKACSNVRFNLDNLIWFCYYDHIGKVHQQGLTELAREAIIKRIGQERFDILYRQAFSPAMEYSVDWLTNVKSIMETYLKELQTNCTDSTDLAAQCHGFNGWK